MKKINYTALDVDGFFYSNMVLLTHFLFCFKSSFGDLFLCPFVFMIKHFFTNVQKNNL